MPKALVISKNLIGDGLYISPAMRVWSEQHLDTEIYLLTNNDHIKCLYYGMGFPIKMMITDCDEKVATTLNHFDTILKFDVAAAAELVDKYKIHVAEAYAKLIGVELPEPRIQTPYGTFKAIRPYYEAPISAWEKAIEKYDNLAGAILFSPFSMSCRSREKDAQGKPKNLPPNKMLPWDKWEMILNYLRGFGKPIRMLGAKEDRAPNSLALMEDEYLTGIPLDELAVVMHRAMLVVTVDNGMLHLAASQSVPHILFYPECLGMHFIVPWGANFTVPIQLDPVTVPMTALMLHIRHATRRVLQLHKEKKDGSGNTKASSFQF